MQALAILLGAKHPAQPQNLEEPGVLPLQEVPGGYPLCWPSVNPCKIGLNGPSEITSMGPSLKANVFIVEVAALVPEGVALEMVSKRLLDYPARGAEYL